LIANFIKGLGKTKMTVTSGWSGSADVVLALFPWTILFSMRQTLNTKERLGIALAMSMGVMYGALTSSSPEAA
jgi:hypothetical protein